MWHKFIQSNLAVFAVLLLAAFACYSPVLKGPFLFDDEFFIEKNETVREFQLKKIYTTGVTQGANVGGNFYRPNQQLAFSVLYKIFGLKPVVFHAFSILCHVLGAFLLFIFFVQLGFSRVGGLIGSFLFLLHPIQTEAVSYISGLADPISCIFLLSGLIFLVKGIKENAAVKWMIVSSLFFILALLSKENMVVFLPLAVVVLLYFNYKHKPKPVNKVWYWLIVFLALDITYLILKFTVLKFEDEAGLTSEKNLYTENLHVRIITFLNILPEYFKMFLWPRHLNYEKPYTAYTDLLVLYVFITTVAVFAFGYFIYKIKKYLTFILALTCFFAVIYTVYKDLISIRVFVIVIALFAFGYSIYKIKKYPALFFAIAWFFVAIFPFSGIVPLNSMYLEHWIYIPVIGFILLIILLFDYLQKKQNQSVMAYFIIIILVLCSYRTYSRNKEWADIEKFYLNELKYSSDAIRIYNNLGMFYAGKKQYTKAISYYQKAIKKWDHFPQPHHNIANIYLDMNRPEDALNELHKALAIDPNFLYSLDKLQMIYAVYGRKDKSDVIISYINQIQQGQKITFEQVDAVMRAK